MTRDSMNSHDENSVPLLIEERAGRNRCNEPVTFGIPFPKGRVADSQSLTLSDVSGRQYPLQTKALAQWFDGSAKWVLLDFQVDVRANSQTVYQIRSNAKQSAKMRSPSLSVQESAEQIVVDTGKATFFLNRQVCKPFDRVVVGQSDLLATQGSSFVLTDEAGEPYFPRIDDLAIETQGPLRATIRARGEMQSASCTSLLRFVVRLSFFGDSNFVQMQITLHNPQAAHHARGLWDLGDEGSIYFKDFSLHIPLLTQGRPRIAWTSNALDSLSDCAAGDLEVYQDSSGGENWRSTNHVNRFGQVTHSFRGYRVTANDRLVEDGHRATPTLAVAGTNGRVAVTIEQFWQNFPKTIEARGNELIVRLFPSQSNNGFELQGGEQKTHRVYLQFAGPEEQQLDLAWTHDRLVPRATPEWYASTRACSYLSPLSNDADGECDELINTAIEGSQSFFARREIIDEYGWRHFGDLYADHEAVGHRGESPLVAHYNNQYDVIYGAVAAYLRGGEARWFELARDLARHVVDIDIYHTQEDRPAYNGGLFWHTDHYLDAGTATHRTYSKASLKVKDPSSYGGGPSNEQNYTSGILHYYYLTGDETARDAVLSLADWVVDMDDGSLRSLGFLDPRRTGMASSTASNNYHGPGRGAGNSINALLDALALTHSDRYLSKAEELIRRCIHPKDNIAARNLDDPEHRWSYLVFLQVLGKYLDIKLKKGEIDFMYGYAQDSLLHYARWMLEHEAPYSTMLHKMELPTETWPAQDIRKCVVFHLAAQHATEDQRETFRQKAEYFFETCIKDLRMFPTRTLTRPLVLLLTNAYVHSYFQMNPSASARQAGEQFDFGRPRRFRPQFYEIQWLRGKILNLMRDLKVKTRGVIGAAPERSLPLEGRDG